MEMRDYESIESRMYGKVAALFVKSFRLTNQVYQATNKTAPHLAYSYAKIAGYGERCQGQEYLSACVSSH